MDELAEWMPFCALLGATTVTSTPAQVRLRLEWSPQRCTAGGVLHGGALMGLADAAGGLCATSTSPPRTAGATPPRRSPRRRTSCARFATGTWTLGRTVIVVDTELVDAAGRRVARVTQTQTVRRVDR
jgi:1,4-dihydroxy-2-naphthoyl-CoA hydrolase